MGRICSNTFTNILFSKEYTYIFEFVACITYVSGEKAGESTSGKDEERIIMLHTMLFYSQLKPVLAIPLLCKEYKMSFY